MPSTQHIISTVIGLCWLIFLVYWLISAIFVKRTVWKQSPAYRLGMSLLFIVAWLFLFGYWNGGPILWSFSPTLGIICAIAAILGLIILIWARVTLGRNWSGTVVFKENHELVTGGPYTYVRHPIYTGILLLALATAVNVGRLGGFIGLVLLFVVFLTRTYQEEKLMIKHFPEYPEYKKRTKRLIPWVW